MQAFMIKSHRMLLEYDEPHLETARTTIRSLTLKHLPDRYKPFWREGVVIEVTSYRIPWKPVYV